MRRESQNINRVVILLLIFLFQVCISALLLNNLSMENWSVIYAEDSEGYLLVADYFAGEEIPPSSVPLLKYRLFSPVVPLMASLLARFLPLENETDPGIGAASKASRYEIYALFFLAFAGLGASAAVLIYALFF